MDAPHYTGADVLRTSSGLVGGATGSGGGMWAPPPALIGDSRDATSATMRYLFALYWAVGLTCQINLPMPDTPAALAFSVVLSAT